MQYQSTKLRFLLLAIISTIIIFQACKKDVEIPINHVQNDSWDVNFVVPQGWPSPYYNFTNNQLTKAGFILGRKLFYDTRLSKDNTVSCGSCHQVFAAFAHSDHAISHGINGLLGNRNSPGLFNLNWHSNFMWDGGINHIEVQPAAPITNPVEMAETINNVVSKLNTDPIYQSMLQTVYGSNEMTTERLFKALAQFMGAMVSENSKYDRYMRKESGVTFTNAELAGMTIFETKCASCHTAPLFSDFSFRNIGLKPTSVNDSGRAHITHNPADLYKFKTPSLRNLSYTAPYYHDGRAATLDAVFDQMESGVEMSPTLDPLMKSGIKLTAEERINLKAFLKTLDDETFVKDNRFFEPL